MRLAFVLNDYLISAWLYESIEKSISLHSIKRCIFILENKTELSKKGVKNELKSYQLIKKLNRFVYNIYVAWDKKNCRNKSYIKNENDAFLPQDIRDLIPQTKFKDIQSIQDFKPDVVFCEGDTNHISYLHELPKYGIWSYSFKIPKNRNGPIGVWEIYYNEGYATVSLERLTDDQGGKQILGQAHISIDSHSLYLTNTFLAWDASPLLPLCLDKLIKTKNPFLNEIAAPYHNTNHYLAPNFLITMLLFAKRILKKWMTSKNYVSHHWSICLTHDVNQIKDGIFDKSQFITLNQPIKKFWADPFLFGIKNKNYLFFEEFDYQTRKGVIKVGEINLNGFIEEPITILKDNFHFSNPFVFEDEGTIYLLPEQAESGEISLYRCVEFPNVWEKASTILKGGYFLDPIILKKDNIFWLFFVDRISSNGSSSVYGRLFFSDNLFGLWQEHPMSPISTDCRFSRSAGAFFYHKNQIIRPVQDCSHGYGYKINYLKIKHLSKTYYEDELSGGISPEQINVAGIHTINFTENATVFDSRK